MRRLSLALVLIAGLAAPAWADFEAGKAAYDRKDYATALREFLPLAEQGNAEAQYWIGVMYTFGMGVTQDFVEAVKWQRKSAEQGDVTSQYMLGVAYSTGVGVTRDYAEAFKWYRLAAEQGHVSGQYNLAFMYFKGRGVTQDYLLSHMWYNLAASGLPPGKKRDIAVKNRAAVEKLMTPSQVAEAQRLAREWKPKTE